MVICLLPGFCWLLVLARLLRPRRIVTAHWHCFLETTPGLTGVYLGFISGLLCGFSLAYLVVTTSPVMSAELKHCGCSPLPMCWFCPAA